MLNGTRVLGGILSAALAASVWIVVPLDAQHRDSSKQQKNGPTGSGSTGSVPADPAVDPGVRDGAPASGAPLDGLTPGELAFFDDGKDAFEEIALVQNAPEGFDQGLGPGFNSDSCASCHAFPAAGGSGARINPQFALATAMGATNRVPPFIRPDGPTLEVRFKNHPDGSPDGGVHNLYAITGRTDAVGCTLAQEDFSNPANLAFRIPTPAFGGGLMEAIPDSTLRANLQDAAGLKASLGISGHLNFNGNDGTITRFGWKAQNKSLAIFAAEAYNVEMGVTNHLFPQERNETPGCNFNASPEDSIDFEDGSMDDVPLFSAFMRFLAPPARGPVDDSVQRGQGLFTQIGCALCHTPALQTGSHSVAALSGKTAAMYSDLAVHHMGPALADDVSQGAAAGDEFRTAPLWGLGQRIFLLHDGRTADLLDAIDAHSSPGNGRYGPSEANQVVDRFRGMARGDQQDLLSFLRSL